MEPPTPPKHPSKRRRTKGVLRLVEGDDGLADGIIVTTTVKQTSNGEVERGLRFQFGKTCQQNHRPRQQSCPRQQNLILILISTTIRCTLMMVFIRTEIIYRLISHPEIQRPKAITFKNSWIEYIQCSMHCFHARYNRPIQSAAVVQLEI